MRASPISRCRGFTLVELLCVIAVVGILAAILFLAVSKVRKSARETECLSNMRQVGAAFHLYATDNKNTLPMQLAASAPQDSNTSWSGQLYPYTGTWDVMSCPEYSGAVKNPVTYLYNQYAAQNPAAYGGSPRGTPTKLTESQSPAQDVLMIDQASAAAGLASLASIPNQNPATLPWWYPHPDTLRSTLYVDGHVAMTTNHIPQYGSKAGDHWSWTIY